MIPLIYSEASDIVTGETYQAVVTKRELLDDSLYTHLRLIDTCMNIVVKGLSKQTIGSTITVMIEDNKCQFVTCTEHNNLSMLQWNTTATFKPYNMIAGSIVTIGFCVLDLFLLLFGAPIVFAISTAISMLLIGAHAAAAQNYNFIAATNCTVIDVCAVPYNNTIKGYALLRASSHIFELTTVAVTSYTSDRLTLGNWELRIGDVISIPLFGNNYLYTYIADTKPPKGLFSTLKSIFKRS